MPPHYSYSYPLANFSGDNESWYPPSAYSSPYTTSFGSPKGGAIPLPSMMSSSASHSVAQRNTTWQDKLESHCRQAHKQTPSYSIVSDRRGKRTAWSCTVSVPGGPTASAIYWYDGQYVNGAKEDAAEVAFRIMSGEGRRGSGSGGSAGSKGRVEEWGRRGS